MMTSKIEKDILKNGFEQVESDEFEEGRLIYGVGAYDRAGTRLETHICLGCGCKWHNSANMNYWNEIISQDRTLTKKDLGFESLI